LRKDRLVEFATPLASSRRRPRCPGPLRCGRWTHLPPLARLPLRRGQRWVRFFGPDRYL